MSTPTINNEDLMEWFKSPKPIVVSKHYVCAYNSSTTNAPFNIKMDRKSIRKFILGLKK
jgi:hypothetical protein